MDFRALKYLAVLSGPNCLAGAAEIQGFLLEAAEGADTPLQITTCSLSAALTVSQKQQITSANKLTVPGLAFGARGGARLGTVVT